MAKPSTDANADTTESQTQEASAETQNNQDSEVTKKLAEYETRIQQLAQIEKRTKELEDQHKTAQAEALRWQSSYKGLQRQTTQAMQQAAEDKRRLVDLERERVQYLQSLSSIEDVRQSVSALASKMLDEDAAKDFNLSQREMLLRRQEELAKQRVQQQQQAVTQQPVQYQPYTDPEEQRKMFLEAYFPGSGVDPNDPSIDWAPDATNPQEAMSRFTSSVYRIFREQLNQPQQGEAVQSEAEKLLEQFRQEREALAASQARALEEVKLEAKRDVEERLRKMGMDAEPPAGNRSASTPRIETRLNALDESSMMSGDVNTRKAAQKKYQDEVEEIKRHLRDKYS